MLRTNAMYSDADQVLGFLASANLMRSPKNGYLLAEFGVNNGEQTAAYRGFISSEMTRSAGHRGAGMSAKQ
jgi:hypothetical protein